MSRISVLGLGAMGRRNRSAPAAIALRAQGLGGENLVAIAKLLP